MADTLERLRHALQDRYAIEHEVGAGGMAIVYLGHDTKLQRAVAVKVLRPELASAVGPDRFLNEIRITAALQHPNILPLYDSGQADTFLYYVMPYVTGESLREFLDRNAPVSIEETVRIISMVANALDYAHRQNIVHRDIKPENILLHDGQALVADFGIALAVSQAGGTRMTSAGFSLGTPHYMSPEQAAADPNVDARSDIFALGCVAYEMLTGEPPHSGGTAAQIIANVVTQPAPDVTQLRQTTPDHLAFAVHRALEKLPTGRWPSAADFAEAMQGPTREMTSATMRRIIPTVEAEEQQFLLSEELCRQLNRETLDPRVIGDTLTYLDNLHPSDTLVVYLHGLGLDHTDFEHVIEMTPHRAIAPCMYGFEPNRDDRPSLPVADHVTLMRACIQHVQQELEPERTVMVGFSLGADLAFQVVGAEGDAAPNVDILLALDPNLTARTCFASSSLATLSGESVSHILESLQELGRRPRSLDEWINLHAYLAKVMKKFRKDLRPLGTLALEASEPFPDDDPRQFIQWFADATNQASLVRCLFSESEANHHGINAVKLANLDSGALGPRYGPESLQVEVGAGHFDLIDQNRLAHHVDGLLEAAEGASVTHIPITD